MIRKRGCGRTEISRGTQDSVSGMEKWLSKIVEVGPNKTRVGSGVYPSIFNQSLQGPPFPSPLSFFSSLGKVPCPCWAQPGPPPALPPPLLPACLPARLQTEAGDPGCCWRSGRFVCSRARREISTINGQQHCRRLQHRSPLPGLAAGWQVGRWREAGAGLAPGPV